MQPRADNTGAAEGRTIRRPDGSTVYEVAETGGAVHLFDVKGKRLSTVYTDRTGGGASANGTGRRSTAAPTAA